MLRKTGMLFVLLFSWSLYAQEGFDQFAAPPQGPDRFDEELDEDLIDEYLDEDISFDPSAMPAPGTRAGQDSPATGAGSRDRESSLADPSEKKVFGRTPTPRPRSAKQSQYVNLNPETAYGPEIVDSFDFPGTDILDVTKHMQELTGINLILDKDVKGKVSISAPTPITVGDAWKAYLAALNMAGYALVKTGAFYKVIRSSDLRYTPTTIYTGDFIPDTENYMMKIIALKNVDATEIERNFRPFMTRFGRIIAIKQTNTIIITDTGNNINRLMTLVQFLDVPGYEETMQIIKVEHTSASEIATLLDDILKDDPRTGRSSGSSARARGGRPAAPVRSQGSSGTGPSISKIIAEPRTNSIIAMANAAGTEHLRELIQKLDVPLGSRGDGRIQVYYLQHGDAENMAQTLSSIISSVQTGAGAGARAGGAAARTGGARGSTMAGAGGPAEEPVFKDDVRVTADIPTNSLVVTSSPTDWITIKDVIERLDIPRDQVFVEGIILETAVNTNNDFGVSYVGAYGLANTERGGFNANSSGLLNLVAGDPSNVSGFFAGFGFGKTRRVEFLNPATNRREGVDVKDVNGLIKAIASKTNGNIIATPQILATDNTEAVFESGETVPIRNSTIANNMTNVTADRQEIKLSLKIKPQINKETRFVKLEIDQKIEDASARDTETEGAGIATIIRSAQTEVIVKDRDTVAMGGLMRDKINDTTSKIPVLGDIPVLGWLFKNSSRVVEKVNMIFFLTPRILSPYNQEAGAVTKNVLDKRANELKKRKVDNDPHNEYAREIMERAERQMRGESGIQLSQQDQEIIEEGSYQDVPDYQQITDEIISEEEEE